MASVAPLRNRVFTGRPTALASLKPSRALRECFFDDLARDDRRPLRAAIVQKRDVHVIESERVEYGRMDVVHMSLLFYSP